MQMFVPGHKTEAASQPGVIPVAHCCPVVGPDLGEVWAQPYPSACTEAMASPAPVLVESVSEDHVLPLGERSGVHAPLLVQEQFLGLATFVRSNRPNALTAADLDLAMALAE
ncbi:hypothetical protein [Streptacidiphilus sp. MAP5-3]|uniref:hypothetical protein n=1 Tax=unclassified Streptacidiphilus TaxID=2643834 RepID=UPI00351302A3